MKEELIESRDFMFDANDEKGFQKLRNNQFPRITQGIIEEPISNSLDQQIGTKPIEILLEKNIENYKLSFIDNGSGLIRENLEALHFIGKTTKSQKKDDLIGRFGLGIIGAFHNKIGVEKIEILTIVCGQSAKILIECNGDKIPTWRMFPLDSNIQGLSLSFYVNIVSFDIVEKALTDFLKNTIIPIKYNEKLFKNSPNYLIDSKNDDLYIFEEGDPSIYYTICTKSLYDYIAKDNLKLYIRGILVQTDHIYSVFYLGLGDKMPTKYCGIPYVKDEQALIISQKAEPTIGRDKIIKNDEFKKIKKTLEAVRVKGIMKLINLAKSKKIDDNFSEYTKYLLLANIETLSSEISNFLNNKPVSNESYKPFLKEITNYKLFPTLFTKNKLSLKDIYEGAIDKQVIIYGTDEELLSSLSVQFMCPFILKDRYILYHPMFGGYKRKYISSFVEPIFKNMGNKIELVKIDHNCHEDKLADLEKRGLLKRISCKISIIKDPNTEHIDFINRLQELLNEPWFKSVINEFDPPKNIKIVPIEQQVGNNQSIVIACVLNNYNESETFTIGVNIKDEVVSKIIKSSNGHTAFLPILCQHLSKRRGEMIQVKDEDYSAAQNHIFEWLELEDRVLKAYVSVISGKEPKHNIFNNLNGNPIKLNDKLVLY